MIFDRSGYVEERFSHTYFPQKRENYTSMKKLYMEQNMAHTIPIKNVIIVFVL